MTGLDCSFCLMMLGLTLAALHSSGELTVNWFPARATYEILSH